MNPLHREAVSDYLRRRTNHKPPFSDALIEEHKHKVIDPTPSKTFAQREAERSRDRAVQAELDRQEKRAEQVRRENLTPEEQSAEAARMLLELREAKVKQWFPGRDSKGALERLERLRDEAREAYAVAVAKVEATTAAKATADNLANHDALQRAILSAKLNAATLNPDSVEAIFNGVHLRRLLGEGIDETNVKWRVEEFAEFEVELAEKAKLAAMEAETTAAAKMASAAKELSDAESVRITQQHRADTNRAVAEGGASV
jgi:hypothetical protein